MAKHLRTKKRRSFRIRSVSPYYHLSANETVIARTEYNVTWDPTCMDSDTILDIQLYLSTLNDVNDQLAHTWQSVPGRLAFYSVSFDPSWWNATALTGVQPLRLAFVETETGSQPPIQFSQGPSFQVMWNTSTTLLSGSVPLSSRPTRSILSSQTSSASSITSSTSNAGATAQTIGIVVASCCVGLALLIILPFIFIRSRRSKQPIAPMPSEPDEKRLTPIPYHWQAFSTDLDPPKPPRTSLDSLIEDPVLMAEPSLAVIRGEARLSISSLPSNSISRPNQFGRKSPLPLHLNPSSNIGFRPQPQSQPRMNSRVVPSHGNRYMFPRPPMSSSSFSSSSINSTTTTSRLKSSPMRFEVVTPSPTKSNFEIQLPANPYPNTNSNRSSGFEVISPRRTYSGHDSSSNSITSSSPSHLASYRSHWF